MTIAVGDHVTLVFPQPPSADPEADAPEPIELNGLVVSAPDPVDQENRTNNESNEKVYHPVLTVLSVSNDSGYTDRYGRHPEYYVNVVHEDDYQEDATGSAGAPAPYYTD